MQYLEKRLMYEKESISRLIATHSAHNEKKAVHTIYKGACTAEEFKELVTTILKALKEKNFKLVMLSETKERVINYSDDLFAFVIYL